MNCFKVVWYLACSGSNTILAFAQIQYYPPRFWYAIGGPCCVGTKRFYTLWFIKWSFSAWFFSGLTDVKQIKSEMVCFRRRKHGPSCPQPGRIAAGRLGRRSPRSRTTKIRTLLAKSNTRKICTWRDVQSYVSFSSSTFRVFGKWTRAKTNHNKNMFLQRSAIVTYITQIIFKILKGVTTNLTVDTGGN